MFKGEIPREGFDGRKEYAAPRADDDRQAPNMRIHLPAESVQQVFYRFCPYGFS